MIWLILKEYEDEKEYYHYREIHKMMETAIGTRKPSSGFITS